MGDGGCPRLDRHGAVVVATDCGLRTDLEFLARALVTSLSRPPSSSSPPAHTDTMPMLLRRNLTCFYCGAKSELKKSPSIRQFDCKECEATNYLDEVSPAPFCLTRVASQGREGAAADQGIFLERRDNRSSCR